MKHVENSKMLLDYFGPFYPLTGNPRSRESECRELSRVSECTRTIRKCYQAICKTTRKNDTTDKITKEIPN